MCLMEPPNNRGDRRYRVEGSIPLGNFFIEENQHKPPGTFSANQLIQFYRAHNPEEQNATLKDAISFLTERNCKVTSIYGDTLDESDKQVYFDFSETNNKLEILKGGNRVVCIENFFAEYDHLTNLNMTQKMHLLSLYQDFEGVVKYDDYENFVLGLLNENEL